MDIERKIEIIMRPPTEEILTIEELKNLLESNPHPIAYNGWEPSGLMHLGTGLICAYKMKDFIEAGIKFKAYLATWHAFINNKLGGDIELIKKAALHFKHGWISLGVPENKIEFIWPENEYNDIKYWEKVIKISKLMTISRAKRTLEIAGRKEIEVNKVADFIYTPMQVADIFQFNVNICQLGMDQRKANVVAKELGESLGFWNPVAVHHHLLQGLSEPPVWPIPENMKKEILISIKMSKSKPKTCIFIYDSPEEIKEKVKRAFCPEKIIEFNPIIDICKHIIFRERNEIIIERPQKYGGRLEIQSFEELCKVYRDGKLHPLDLKNAVTEILIEILEPSRKYFQENREAKETLEILKKATITR
ncbi:MAG: tyrosine--tRNA ligase [Candidatus Aenigmatarchaeota archaeon]|nr:tyrosine--tRNA ligase [Candidatus Aenigmarchaeota archaeon]